MPAFCAVYGCSNRHDKKGKVMLSSTIVIVIIHPGETTKELSLAEKWLANISRSA
jgi:hypothetical protein